MYKLYSWESLNDPNRSYKNFTSKESCVADIVQRYGTLPRQLFLVHVSSEKHNHPQFEAYEARLETFSNWPPAIPFDPVDLANTGLFYEGIGDQTVCYSCGKRLSLWLKGQSIIQKHSNASPNCVTLRREEKEERCDSLLIDV